MFDYSSEAQRQRALKRWPVTADRFWCNVNKNGPVPPHRPDLGPCWEWTAHVLDSGYGESTYKGKQMRAHRISFLIHTGTLTPGMCVCHKCDNRRCVNPLHLFEGTKKQNTHDMIEKGRDDLAHPQPGELNGSVKLSSAQVLEIRSAYKGENGQQTSLAKQYGVSQAAIWNIVMRRSWRHL
jgi:hypothetical protein